MEVNTRKTKFLCLNTSHALGTTPNGIKVQGLKIDEVDEFSYLGAPVTREVSLDAKINHGMGKASSAFFRLKQRVFQNRELRTRKEW